MTTFAVPGAAVTPAAAPPAPPVPPSCRVSILVGDSHQIDLVLPAAAPLSTLIEPTVAAINKVLRGRGATELPSAVYEFARGAGMTALTSDLSLAAHNVADGDLLALLPAGDAERYGPVVENVSTALAHYASERFTRVSAATAVAVAAAITGGALAVAAVLLWRLRWATGGTILVPAVFAGAVAVLVFTAVMAARVGAARVAVDGASWAAFVFAVLAATTAPPGSAPGAPHAFFAAVTAVAAAWLLVRLTGRHWATGAAVITAGTGAVAVSAVLMYWGVLPHRVAIAVLVAVLVAVSAAPTVALRLAHVPRQTFGSITGRDIFARQPGQPEDTVSPVESGTDATLTGEQVAAAALRSNTVLTGVLVGVAAVMVPASLVAVTPGAHQQWANLVVVGAVAGIFILRARAFRDRTHAIILVAAAAAALVGAAARYGFHAPATAVAGTLIAAGAALGVAVAGILAATLVPPRLFSPPVRKVVEYVEYILLATLIPFAAWAIGLLSYIRYH